MQYWPSQAYIRLAPCTAAQPRFPNVMWKQIQHQMRVGRKAASRGDTMKSFSDKVAVVTGGAGGIGKALCEELVAEGAKVVVTDVQEALLEQTTSGFKANGADVLGVQSDVSDPTSMEALADRTWSTYGACHLLFNNAGVGAPAAKPWESTPNDWRWVFGVNVFGVANGVMAFVPRMIDDGNEGHVVNTSSPNGGLSHMPTAAVYAASKAAVSS